MGISVFNGAMDGRVKINGEGVLPFPPVGRTNITRIFLISDHSDHLILPWNIKEREVVVNK